MSGMDAGPPPEVPEEYAAVYRDAYRRALGESAGAQPAPGTDDLLPWVERPQRPGPARFGPVLLALLAVLGGCVALGISLLSGSSPEEESPGTVIAARPSASPESTGGPASARPSPTPAVSPTASVVKVWRGPVDPVSLGNATASCTGAPSADAAGRPVRYEAGNATDGDPGTAWRCDTAALGERLTVALPAGAEVVELGLIPGYAKVDATSGADRFVENNRVTRVRWTLEGGASFVQELDPADPTMQTIRIPRTASGAVTLEVLAVERGRRNRTAVSEIAVGQPG